MSSSPKNWPMRIGQIIRRARKYSRAHERFARANIKAVQAVIAGYGPDITEADPEAGARMVVNIAAVHVPAFCQASFLNDPKPYKNGYDLEKYRIGDASVKKNRELVDAALLLDSPATASDVYFGAVELNGCGIRFYGDICFVLKQKTLSDDTVILDRNSYDLIREPIRAIIDSVHPKNQPLLRQRVACKLRGLWKNDLGAMAALKVFNSIGVDARRITTGQVSEVLRNDEDYIEVLKIGSFRASDLQEARLASGDAAHDAFTTNRLFQSPSPRLESLMTTFRRREAERALRQQSVALKVVSTSGRTKD